MRKANWIMVNQTSEVVLIQDVGPWDRHPTVTNDAEGVVAEIAPSLNGRRLEYIDSDGQRDELVVKDGKFAGFRPGQRGLAGA